MTKNDIELINETRKTKRKQRGSDQKIHSNKENMLRFYNINKDFS